MEEVVKNINALKGQNINNPGCNPGNEKQKRVVREQMLKKVIV